ncbi:MAG TPA: response regulator [Ktedonobacteraceae bacterium]|nr:response regulator [Ktedonobacteraceae bacterium]
MAKIVFCEDEAFLQKLIRLIMRSTPHEIYIASDGLEGFALIERERPDLIMTDISMPGWDGFQLADAVKARPHLAAIPIIFVTAFAQRLDVEEGALHGAKGYLLKPFNAADLRTTIEGALVADGRCSRGGNDESTQSTEHH